MPFFTSLQHFGQKLFQPLEYKTSSWGHFDSSVLWPIIFQECSCQEFAFSLIRGVLSSCVCKELSKKETGFSSQKLRLFLPAHIALHHSGVSNLFFLRKLFRTLSIYFVTSLATYHVRVVSNSGPFHTSVFMLSFWGHLFCPSLLLSVSNGPYALQHTYTNADLQEVRYLQRGCTIATNSLSGTLKICTFGYMSVIPP